MTSVDLKQLLECGESDRVERTRSTSDTDKFREAICAFSNDLPQHGLDGYLLVGVEDDGRPSGLVATDELLKKFAGYRDDGQILPQPSMDVFKMDHPAGGGEVIVVQVHPHPMPPVRFKGRIHVRTGPRKAIANEADERRLSERRGANFSTFDAMPCMEGDLRRLDLASFSQSYRTRAVDPLVIEENHRPIEEQLAALRFFNLARNRPTNAGMLMFAFDPLDIFPGARVQFVQFAGLGVEDDVRAEKSFTGNLSGILGQLDIFLSGRFTQRPVMATALREVNVFDYPPVAVRELLMNAVLHRDYQSTSPVRFYEFSDRIEIQNPGGLYGEASESNFPRVNAYRNPIIAEAMSVLGYVNRFGRGVALAQRVLRENGSPPAAFDFALGGHFIAKIAKRPSP